MYRQTNQEFATKYIWWFFLIQAAPLPEHLIGLDPQYYLEVILNGLNKTPGALTPEAVSEYRRCFCCTSTIHATCEDLRAAADIDLEMDEADDRARNEIVAPVQALIQKELIMSLENVSYTTNVRSTRSWSELSMKHRVLHRVFFHLFLAAQLTPDSVWAQTTVAPPISGVIGKVHAFTGNSLDVQTPSGVVHVEVRQPLTTYKQIPSDLSRVTSSSYIGVASVEQADGTQIAK